MKRVKDKFQEYWHVFKIWFCKEEVDFFQKKIKQLEFILEQERVKYDFLDKTDAKAIDVLNAQIAQQQQDNLSLLAVDPRKIIRLEQIVADEFGRPVAKKIFTIGDEKLNPEQSRILREEATYLKGTTIWSYFQNTIAETARRTMFEQSKTFEDMRTGKALLYNLDVLKKIIERILE